MNRAILFVCMGNICRSPAAEGVFRQVLRRRKLDRRVSIDSAGTIGYHAGAPPDSRMQQAADHRGYRLGGQARQFERSDFERFDLIVAMDQSNQRDLLGLAQGAQGTKVRLLSEFLSAEWPTDVPDPYYGGADGFEQVLDMIEAACDGLIDTLMSPSPEQSKR